MGNTTRIKRIDNSLRNIVISKEKKYILLSFDVESDIGSWTQNYTSVDKAIP